MPLPFLFAFLFILATARGEIVHVRVGGAALRIPVPEGFVRYDGRSQKVDGLEAAFLPAAHRILAAFGEPADGQNAAGGEFPRLTRSFSAQENWQYADAALSREEFATVQGALREQMETLRRAPGAAVAEVERSASSALSSELDTSLQVRVGEVVPYGVFAETPAATCFSLLVKSRLAGPPLPDPIDPATAVAGCVMLVRERVLYLYANSSYEGKSDADWARQQVLAWRDAVAAANAPGAPEDESDLPPEPLAGEEGSRKRKWRVAGAAAVLLAAWWLWRRKPLRLP